MQKVQSGWVCYFTLYNNQINARALIGQGTKVKSAYGPQSAHQAGAYLLFQWHEATRSISTPPWMGCQSIAGLPPSIKFAGTHSYTWVERGTVRPCPHVSGNLWKRKFFFTNTACVHTYPAYFQAVSGNFWKRSPEWKFFYPIRIRIRVDVLSGNFWIRLHSHYILILLDPVFTASIINKHGVQQGCSFFVSCSYF